MEAQKLPEVVHQNKWKKRIVLLYAPSSANEALRQQRALLAQDKSGLHERDVLVVEAYEPQLSPAERHYLHTTLSVPPSSFMLLLIGKDGGVKRREKVPLKTSELFLTIDSMPMRRQEMLR